MWPFKPKILQETVADLKSGEEILAKAKDKKPHGSKLDWTFYLNEKPFVLISSVDGSTLPSVRFLEGFQISDAQHTLTTTKVELRTYYASHHGSVMSEWLLTFNIETMIALVEFREHVDVDS
jgi:hypothetical protein